METRKERLEIAQWEYNEYVAKRQSAIDAWENPERINTFDVYLSNAIEKEKTLAEWYVQI
jgi:hypothetical protein